MARSSRTGMLLVVGRKAGNGVGIVAADPDETPSQNTPFPFVFHVH